MRYEIQVLIGPCTNDEAENAADEIVSLFAELDGPPLGATVSMSVWQEDVSACEHRTALSLGGESA